LSGGDDGSMIARHRLAQETAMSDDQLVTREQRGPVTILSMVNRPHNLISRDLMRALLDELEAARNAGSRAIVIRSGLRHFSAGAELTAFDAPAAGAAPDFGAVTILQAFERLPIPIIASIHGVCLGAGFELALACDYIIAAASAKIGSVEPSVGLQPLLGAVQRQVQRAGTLRAKEISMLGRRYDPATLERWGLINLTVPDEALHSTTMAIAEEFGHGPTVAHAATKELAYIAANEGVLAADEAMLRLQQPIWASQDLKTGLAAIRESGPGMAKFEGR
jgi:enoyl-CoA hydratase/carnithine racemase